MDFGAFYHKIDVIYEDVIQLARTEFKFLLSLNRPPSIYSFLKQVDVNRTWCRDLAEAEHIWSCQYLGERWSEKSNPELQNWRKVMQSDWCTITRVQVLIFCKRERLFQSTLLHLVGLWLGILGDGDDWNWFDSWWNLWVRAYHNINNYRELPTTYISLFYQELKVAYIALQPLILSL